MPFDSSTSPGYLAVSAPLSQGNAGPVIALERALAWQDVGRRGPDCRSIDHSLRPHPGPIIRALPQSIASMPRSIGGAMRTTPHPSAWAFLSSFAARRGRLRSLWRQCKQAQASQDPRAWSNAKCAELQQAWSPSALSQAASTGRRPMADGTVHVVFANNVKAGRLRNTRGGCVEQLHEFSAM